MFLSNLFKKETKIKRLTPWKPVRYGYFKSQAIENEIYENGYLISDDFISETQLSQLTDLYKNNHKFSDTGLFWGVYSQDFVYRKMIHDEVQRIMQPSYDRFFKNYNNIINFFIVKTPGHGSELNIHQDTTFIDEFKHSSISIWIPLTDVDEHNGAMSIVPKSHHFFSPYRGISFATTFSDCEPEARKYLKPLPMKRGQALLFDPRTIHHSYQNNTEEPRAAMVCGIYPKGARILFCFKDPNVTDSKVELIDQEEEFLLTYPYFHLNAFDRPHVGTLLGYANEKYLTLHVSKEQFLDLCKANNLQEYNKVVPEYDHHILLISEPV